MDECMDGLLGVCWVDGWMCGWMDERVNGCMCRWVDGRMHGWM
jgi:hypothetical protein